MEYKIHKVGAEEKLSEIAEKYSVSIEDIKRINPNIKFFKEFLGSEYVAAMQNLKIPIFKPVTLNESEDEKNLKNLDFEEIARYRCNQNNITKALESITFSSNIKTQYLLSTANDETKYFSTILEDYISQITPQELGASFELVEPLEFIKNNIVFSQNKEAEFIDILNFNQIKQKWEQFKKSTLPNINFYKQLKEQSKETTNDFIKTGNSEFTNETKFKEILHKNLFFHILLKANVGNDLNDYSFKQFSQIFPNQELTINVKKTLVSENENTIVYRLVGELENEKLSEKKLKKLYNEIYKPLLKFSFTEFNYIYRITYTLDIKTGLLIDAKASLSEKVKNNFESITQFEINQVEL